LLGRFFDAVGRTVDLAPQTKGDVARVGVELSSTQ